MKKILPACWLITDSSQMDVIKAARNLTRDSGIILRDYDLPVAERFCLGLALKKICIRKKIPLLVAGDARLAIKIKADGIHLPEYAADKIRFWRLKKNSWIITTAAHSQVAVRIAVNNGADAVLISPIFKTSSHPGKPALGILRSTKYLSIHEKKLTSAYALGGVKTKHDKALKMAGFKGFAGISWIKN